MRQLNFRLSEWDVFGPESTGVCRPIQIGTTVRRRRPSYTSSRSKRPRWRQVSVWPIRVLTKQLNHHVVSQVEEFVGRNNRLLLDYWSGKIGTTELVAKMRSSSL